VYFKNNFKKTFNSLQETYIAQFLMHFLLINQTLPILWMRLCNYNIGHCQKLQLILSRSTCITCRGVLRPVGPIKWIWMYSSNKMKQWPLSNVIKQMKEEHSSELNWTTSQMISSSFIFGEFCNACRIMWCKFCSCCKNINNGNNNWRKLSLQIRNRGVSNKLSKYKKNKDHFNTKYVFTKQFINCCN